MIREDKAVRRKIIIATLECIEKVGFHSLTTRGIAKEAGVNSAAINYYFGAKEKLVEESLEYALSNALGDSAAIIAREELDPRTKVHTVFLFFFIGMLRYPGLIKAFFFEPFTKGDYAGLFFQRFSHIFDGLVKGLEPMVAEAKRAELKLALVQIWASINFIGLFPGFFQDFLGYDFREPEKQVEFIEHLFRNYQLGISFTELAEEKQLIMQLVESYMKD